MGLISSDCFRLNIDAQRKRGKMGLKEMVLKKKVNQTLLLKELLNEHSKGKNGNTKIRNFTNKDIIKEEAEICNLLDDITKKFGSSKSFDKD